MKIEVYEIFVYYLGGMLLVLGGLWLRNIINFGKGWQVPEDAIIDCKECGVKFLADSKAATARCPKCNNLCELRWKN